MAEEEKEEKIDVKELLSLPDAIFEPNANELVKEYLKHGSEAGQTEEKKMVEAVKALTSGFQGYSSMVTLLGHWLEDSGCEVQEIKSVLTNTVANKVKSVYDPQCTRSVFQTKSRNIPWMNFMVRNPFWRQVLYELSEAHKSDSVLGLALSRIEELGHQEELATILLGFRLFNRAIVQSVTKMTAGNEQKMIEDLAKFKKMCTQSPNTYLYSQLVLLHASRLPNGSHLMRLFEELEQHVVTEHKEKIVPRMGFLLMGLSQHKDLYTGVLTMIENGKTNPADIMKLYRAYSGQEALTTRVDFLQNYSLLKMLVDELYTTGVDIPSKYLDKYIYVLAYAADQKNLKLCQKAIAMSSNIAKKNMFGSELEKHVSLLQHYIASFLVVSMGVLRWIQCSLCDRSYYEKGTHSLSLKRFVAFVVEIGATHAKQTPHCMRLLKQAYEAVESAETEEGMVGEGVMVKNRILEGVIQLMLLGDSEIIAFVMEWIQGLLKRSDVTIIRHFVKNLLSNVCPPYSAEFVEFVSTILVHCIPNNPDITYVQQLLSVFQEFPGGPSVVDRFLKELEQQSYGSKTRELIEKVILRVNPRKAAALAAEKKKAAKPAAVVTSSTIIKIANLDPSLIKRTAEQRAEEIRESRRKQYHLSKKKGRKKESKSLNLYDDYDEEEEDEDYNEKIHQAKSKKRQKERNEEEEELVEEEEEEEEVEDDFEIIDEDEEEGDLEFKPKAKSKKKKAASVAIKQKHSSDAFVLTNSKKKKKEEEPKAKAKKVKKKRTREEEDDFDDEEDEDEEEEFVLDTKVSPRKRSTRQTKPLSVLVPAAALKKTKTTPKVNADEEVFLEDDDVFLE